MFSVHKIAFYGDRIDACVTDDPSVVTRWVAGVQRAHRLWLNRLVVEWRPNLEPGVVHPVAVLQPCVGRSCLVFQILRAEYVPASLHAFLASPNFAFVGVGVEDDAAKLSGDLGLAVARAVDLRALAAGKWRNPSFGYMGLKKLVKVVLGKDLEKPREITLSRRDGEAPMARQVEYACLDAFVTFELGMALQAWPAGRARARWVRRG